MRYGEILPAVFLSRPNRFIAHVLVEGEEVVGECHTFICLDYVGAKV